MKKNFLSLTMCVLAFSIFLLTATDPLHAQSTDLILHNGRVVTVDKTFTVQQALVVHGSKILQVGSNENILKLKTATTQIIDLAGKMVLPGLIDSHAHFVPASQTEFDHPIPQMDTIQDVLNYVKARTAALKEGEWIVVQQVFITRLREQRYPTRTELDTVAPRHPVVFRTGPDASLNTLALKLSGIDENFKVTDGGPGYAEKDPQTGRLTGILRSLRRFIKIKDPARKPSDTDRYKRLVRLFKDYNSVGITGVCDGSSGFSNLDIYQKLLQNRDLTVRVWAQHYIDTIGPLENIQKNIRQIARHPLCKGNPMIRLIGIKAYLDGGMLTGSAYMRKPWGVSKIYSITDPDYRGVLFIPPERLLPIVRTTFKCNLQFTAHSVGDGAVHALLDVYDQLSKDFPLHQLRPCITHSNFMSPQSIEMSARLGVIPLIQPAWLYLDTRTLTQHFGYDRLRYFQPLRSLYRAGAIAGGGSDHMQKIGSIRSINPYDPFLGIWTTLTRRAKWYNGRLHPEEALDREQAIRFYTINAAYAMLAENRIGSLEPGKQADFIVLDTDLLTCPVDDIRRARVLRTYLDGRLVFQRP